VVGLTQVLGAQHDPVVAVLAHPVIVPYRSDGGGPPGRAGRPGTAARCPSWPGRG
jgi:hypothetical protein